jgi:hypothetical protein
MNVESKFALSTRAADGWIEVLDKSKKVVPLPDQLMIDVKGEPSDGRQSFTILEGVYKGQTMSALLSADPISKNAIYSYPAFLKFHPGKKRLRVGMRGEPYELELNAKTDYRNSPPEGTHKIGIPDNPWHTETVKPHGKTWFPIIGYPKKYLHPGTVSEGCITVTDLDKWDEIYKRLIVSRLEPGIVGKIQICPPETKEWCFFFSGDYKFLVDEVYEGHVMAASFQPQSADTMAFRATTKPERYNFEGIFRYTPGGTFEGHWTDQRPKRGEKGFGDFRLGFWEVGAWQDGLLAPVTLEMRGSITEGRWGAAGTIKHAIKLTATAPKERPWYNYPWNLPQWPPPLAPLA